ncbi:hypothetical protein SAMN04487911_10423 [Arenibacter nanhaiticus]|uniref:Uncharacterized protein n=1 Tax=Arenibacter nanhaiticus TaxID=558155 RepID=A0A1M6CQX7_9FLAO|nr:hypothetical protein SAMN04487911_10423 [Arenibacter nanhaiticus]
MIEELLTFTMNLIDQYPYFSIGLCLVLVLFLIGVEVKSKYSNK